MYSGHSSAGSEHANTVTALSPPPVQLSAAACLAWQQGNNAVQGPSVTSNGGPCVCCCRRLVQVLGSFGLSVALSKSAVLAGPALLFPIWGPWMRAGVRNVQVHMSHTAGRTGKRYMCCTGKSHPTVRAAPVQVNHPTLQLLWNLTRQQATAVAVPSRVIPKLGMFSAACVHGTLTRCCTVLPVSSCAAAVVPAPVHLCGPVAQ